MFQTIVVTDLVIDIITKLGLETNNDNKICACAELLSREDDIVFVTNDICCKMIAKEILKLNVESTNIKTDDTYLGYIEKTLNEDEMAYFYEHISENIYDLLVNQYLVIHFDGSEEGYRWDGEGYQSIFKKPIRSLSFGDKLKPKDIYQSFVIDSIMKNTITAITGKAGSGKSLLSLMVSMNLVDQGKYDRIVILFNPTKSKGATDLGFYSGSFEEKALQNSIGQILTTKFGDRYIVDTLLQQEKIKLVSMADARGMEIRDNEILYITEAQNTSVDLIKLCLSRVSSGAKVIIEGDYTSQLDNFAFEGNKNGLKRVIDCFSGQDIFGYIQLKNIWRSKIAELCELL